jgi:hypothetical protein
MRLSLQSLVGGRIHDTVQYCACMDSYFVKTKDSDGAEVYLGSCVMMEDR